VYYKRKVKGKDGVAQSKKKILIKKLIVGIGELRVSETKKDYVYVEKKLND
jgi:hypothetical protein